MKIIVIVLFLIFLFSSCYTYKNGKLTPLYGWYKLKNKVSTLPESLDTNNLYKLKKEYKNGELVYSDSILLNHKKTSFNESYQGGYYYIKFYGKGRCQSFSKNRFDINKNKIFLLEEDLNPMNIGNILSYYYFIDSINLQIETFTKGDGGGAYIILDYELSLDGKNIFYRDKYSYIIYELYKIPEKWNKYNYYW